MFIFRWASKLIDTVNSWEEGIALSVMILAGGVALILFIYAYSSLYHMFNDKDASKHRPAMAAHPTVSPVRLSQSYSHQFGKPRDLDARGNEARAAGVVPY